jgi:hypothetical protein
VKAWTAYDIDFIQGERVQSFLPTVARNAENLRRSAVPTNPDVVYGLKEGTSVPSLLLSLVLAHLKTDSSAWPTVAKVVLE